MHFDNTISKPDGSGQSAAQDGANTAVSLAEATDARYAAGDVERADVKPKPPSRSRMFSRRIVFSVRSSLRSSSLS